MGEAGPEAIMPLTRLPNGKLGVHSGGNGGSGNSVTIVNDIKMTVSGGGNEEHNKDLANKTAKELTTQLDMKIDQRMREHMRPGGMLNQGTKT